MALLVLPPNCCAFWYMRSHLPFLGWSTINTNLLHINFFGSIGFSSQLTFGHFILFEICVFHFSSVLYLVNHFLSCPRFAWCSFHLPNIIIYNTEQNPFRLSLTIFYAPFEFISITSFASFSLQLTVFKFHYSFVLPAFLIGFKLVCISTWRLRSESPSAPASVFTSLIFFLMRSFTRSNHLVAFSVSWALPYVQFECYITK